MNRADGADGVEGSDSVVNHVLPAWDLITGQMVAVGLLAAERHRRRSGQGQHVKLALEDVALAVMERGAVDREFVNPSVEILQCGIVREL